MALESFYGGRQGVSPVIKARFEFITTNDEAYQAKLNTENLPLTDWEKHILKHYNRLSDEWKVKVKDDEYEYIIPKWEPEFLDLFVMDEQFKKVDYTDVWYDELCIIDTPNKMNPNNGKIFRRTLKRYKDPRLTGISDERAIYAEYVGQIVGPSGGVPNLVFGSLDDVRKDAAGRYITIEKIDLNDSEISDLPNKLTQEVYDSLSSEQQSKYHFVEHYYNVKNWDYLYPDATTDKAEITAKNIEGTLPNTRSIKKQYLSENSEIDYWDTTAREDDYKKIAILNSGDNNNITIVPGKDENNNFNDKIRYTWCNVRRNLNHAFNDTTNPDYEDEAWIYLGFEIPYTSWDVSATHIPYWLNTDEVGNIVDIQKLNETDESIDHPFYHNLHFYIPRGTRGIGPEEIVLVKSQIDNNKNKTNNHPKKNGRLVSLYDMKDILYDSSSDTYSLKENASPVTSLPDSYWIAKWTLYNPKKQAFKNKELVTNANFTVNINAKDESTYEEVWIYLGEYKDITSIKYDDNTGKIQIQYSNKLLDENETKIAWIPIDGEINYAKTLRVDTNPESPNYGDIYKISNINEKDPELTGDTLPLIKSVTSNAGALTFNYSGIGNIEAQGKIREIVDFDSTEAGHLLITFNEKLPVEYGKTPVKEKEPYTYTYDFANIYGQGLTGMNNVYFEKEQDNSIQILPDQDATNVTVTFFKSSSNNTTDGLAKIWENPSNNSNGS